jgi:hypothetical protein
LRHSLQEDPPLGLFDVIVARASLFKGCILGLFAVLCPRTCWMFSRSGLPSYSTPALRFWSAAASGWSTCSVPAATPVEMGAPEAGTLPAAAAADPATMRTLEISTSEAGAFDTHFASPTVTEFAAATTLFAAGCLQLWASRRAQLLRRAHRRLKPRTSRRARPSLFAAARPPPRTPRLVRSSRARTAPSATDGLQLAPLDIHSLLLGGCNLGLLARATSLDLLLAAPLLTGKYPLKD